MVSSTYKGFRFPREIIAHCVWLHHRFTLSFRDIELLMADRGGVEVTYETIRTWCTRFGPEYARRLRRQTPPRPGDRWHLDEVFIKIGGVRKYRWRAVDQHGNVPDVLTQDKRDGKAAPRFFRILLKHQSHPPRMLVTNKLPQLPGHAPDHYVDGRAPAEQILQQSVRELPSTDPATRTRHERVPLCRCSATVSGRFQAHLPRTSTHRDTGVTATDHRTDMTTLGVGSGHRTAP